MSLLSRIQIAMRTRLCVVPEPKSCDTQASGAEEEAQRPNMQSRQTWCEIDGGWGEAKNMHLVAPPV